MINVVEIGKGNRDWIFLIVITVRVIYPAVYMFESNCIRVSSQIHLESEDPTASNSAAQRTLSIMNQQCWNTWPNQAFGDVGPRTLLRPIVLVSVVTSS
ncbi:hypothetical protein BYT27DRAFT_6781407 [Phlegmacium glaucopus]|nr:hypothetical protein BYT27DRAFT_6781407 [Phlegmacium glaucopus]